MSRDASPKYDRLRELREARFEESQRANAEARRQTAQSLVNKIASIPARKPKAVKKKRR